MDELRCLLDTPYLRVSYDVDHEWLYSELLGVHSEESVIRCTESIFACLAKQPCTKMLCDHSQLLGDWQGISARRALYFTTNPAVAIFSDVASAYQWLLQLPKH
jgi:hypothetical protein